MDVREKLVELFFDAQQTVSVPYGMDTENATRYIFEQMADHLIAHGVTVQDEPVKMVIPEGVDEKALMEMIRNAPLQILPCEPVQEWISVDDRLPDKLGNYLTYDPRYGDIEIYHYMGFGEWDHHRNGITDAEGHGFAHWMPLPPAPKGE